MFGLFLNTPRKQKLHEIINGTVFGEKSTEHKMFFLFYLQILSEIFVIPWSIQRDFVINVRKSSWKTRTILSGFNETRILETDFRKKKVSKLISLLNVHPMEAESFHADRRKEGQTDMKLTVLRPAISAQVLLGFPVSVYKRMLGWFPVLQAATACFSCSPPRSNKTPPFLCLLCLICM